MQKTPVMTFFFIFQKNIVKAKPRKIRFKVPEFQSSIEQKNGKIELLVNESEFEIQKYWKKSPIKLNIFDQKLFKETGKKENIYAPVKLQAKVMNGSVT